MQQPQQTLESTEAFRLKDLYRYGILDTPEEPQFQCLIELVAKKFNFPIAAITLVDEHRYWFKAKIGMEVSELLRSNELCSRVVTEQQTLTYRDLNEHSKLAKLELVSGPFQARAYAGAPLITPNGAAIGTLCLFDTVPHELSSEEIEDLCDFAELGMQLIEAHREKEEQYQNLKLKSIERLAGGVAHEFNNLHSSILSSVDLIHDTAEGQSPEILSYLNIIKASSERAADLTKQLLSFARKGKYKVERISLNPLLEEFSTLLRASVHAEHQITCDCCDETLFVDGDRNQIRAALLNIALNGLDAMPSNGELHIESSKTQLTLSDPLCQINQLKAGSYACISIQDQGSGMSPETAKQIFDPFFTNKHPSKGNGLGLPAAQGTIANHGGAITLHTKIGQGSRMSIYLPLTKHAGKQIPPSPKHEFSGHVLLAEDEEMVREVTKLLLASMGFKIDPFEDGFQAVQQLENNPPAYDLLVLDISMPGKDGLQVAKIAQQTLPEAAILFISGNAPEEQLQPLLAHPNIGFLQKPFGKKQLVTAMEEILIQAQA